MGKAKAAGRAIGKRKSGGESGFLPIQKPSPVIQPPCYIHPTTTIKKDADPPRLIAAQDSKSLFNAEPVRPVSATYEMWKDYRIFKAAGLLSEWRRKWNYYLPPLTA